MVSPWDSEVFPLILTYCAVIVHETMLGLKKSEAGDDLVAVAKHKSVHKKVHEEPEEWNGFGS
jgi:hypothetical protein